MLRTLFVCLVHMFVSPPRVRVSSIGVVRKIGGAGLRAGVSVLVPGSCVGSVFPGEGPWSGVPSPVPFPPLFVRIDRLFVFMFCMLLFVDSLFNFGIYFTCTP